MTTDRITEDADWKDGINQFRLMILKELKEMNKEIKTIKQIIKGETL